MSEVPGTVTVTGTRTGLIEPHGGALVDRTGARPDDLDSLETIALTPREVSDLDMLASGALSPLEGFMGREDYERVVEDMHLANGLAWAMPVCLAVEAAPEGTASRSPTAKAARWPCSRSRRSTTTTRSARRRTASARRTRRIPGSPASTRSTRATSPARSPSSTDPSRRSRSWRRIPRTPAGSSRTEAGRRVVGFQTRNPIHRAHEYLTKVALETVDGLLIHPLVGETKSDDVPAATRVACYSVLVDKYYPDDRVVVSAFPAAMRYAGPREAIWHAICRKNYGCSHFIVGRDHAGVGDYYGTYDAQLIFGEFEPHELGIEPLFFEHAFWCKVCGSMATPKTCPHGGDDHVFLSGTKVRELLQAGELPPVEFSRPEVAEVLIDAYR